MKVICGDANPNGNVELTYKGGCGKELDIKDAYRCTGCGGWFHLDCIFKHFELEEGHDFSRNALKKIKDYSTNKKILRLCRQGLIKNLSLKQKYEKKD